MTIDTDKAPVVLLVEDNTFDVQLIKTALGRTPGEINLIRVDDGDKAVDYLTGLAPFDDREKYPIPITILLDIKLPRRSGLEVLQWLRTQEGPIKRLPAVMLTSSNHQVDINGAFERGANAYLTKPESVKELTSLLGEFKNFWLKRMEFPQVVQ
jgi:CheY-like chemotaxis protein